MCVAIKMKLIRELQYYMWQCSKYRNINKMQSKIYLSRCFRCEKTPLTITSEAGLLI